MKKMLICLALFFLFLATGAAAGESLCFHHTGVAGKVPGGVPVWPEPGKQAEASFRMDPGETCLVLGESGTFFRIEKDGAAGYVEKRFMTMRPEASPAIRESPCASVSLADPAPGRLDTHLVLQGTLTSDVPMDTLFFYVWDERQFTVEYARMIPLREPSRSVSMEDYPFLLPMKEMEGGRKTLVIEAASGADLFVLYRTPAYVRGKSLELPHVTRLCSGLPFSLLDTDPDTAWNARPGAPSLAFSVPEGAQAVIMTLEWKVPPEAFTVDMMDEDGRLLSRTDKGDGFYADCVDLPPEVRRVIVTPVGEKAALSTLRLYAEPYSRHVIQKWEKIPDKVDLLIISAHQDDEFLFFGGAIPAYAAREDMTTAVLYMAFCNRMRYREALDALWSAGLKYHPIFLGLKDGLFPSVKEARGVWDREDPPGLIRLIRVIRQYRPEVILCQDFDGEYGNPQHKLTAILTAEAVEQAAREDVDPESAALYGVWQPRKLYVHLYAENQIRMDWNVPLDDTGVITPMFLAKEAFDRNLSQTASFSVEGDGAKYDNTLFGLYFSTVGPDEEKNDFMEHILP